jgi:flagellar protein FliO/FliZ
MTQPADFSWLQVIFSFAIVMALIGGLALVLKYIGMRGLVLPGKGLNARRMRIVETMPIDTRRRFVILRCDEREHLLLLTTQGDIVVQTNLSSLGQTPS